MHCVCVVVSYLHCIVVVCVDICMVICVIVCGVVVSIVVSCVIVVCIAGVGGRVCFVLCIWEGGRWCDIPTTWKMMVRTYSNKSSGILANSIEERRVP